MRGGAVGENYALVRDYVVGDVGDEGLVVLVLVFIPRIGLRSDSMCGRLECKKRGLSVGTDHDLWDREGWVTRVA